MARSATAGLRADGVTPPVALRRYLARRSALELVVLDGLVLATALWVTLPAALSLDAFWVQILAVLSPGLLPVARSMVVALHLSGVFALAQLDPAAAIEEDPRLDHARHLTWVGLLVLAATAVPASAYVVAVA